MRYLSVCSGIEAASVAWEPLGWSPVAFAEIEPFPSAILTHRFPSVPNWGDMTKFQEWPEGHTLREIADALGISAPRAWKISKAADSSPPQNEG